jgi:hypothetical protein
MRTIGITAMAFMLIAALAIIGNGLRRGVGMGGKPDRIDTFCLGCIATGSPLLILSALG